MASANPVRSVEAVRARYIEASRPINISALLAYKSTQKLSFKVGGLVSEILVDEGDAVIKGQVLARLDVEEVAAQVGEAEARYDNALRTVERMKKLYKKKVVSLDQLQDAETELDVISSQLSVARFNLRYSEIKAPGNGRIIRKSIEINEFVSPNQTALILSDESRGWIMRTGLSDRKVVRVQKGDPVSVRFDPWPLQVFQGAISSISEAAEERSGLFEVEIALEPTDKRLRDGYIGRIHIEPGKTHKVILLPALSLVSANSSAGVIYVMNPDRSVSLRRVQVHYLEGSEVAVSGEIEENEKIITTGAEFLNNGDKVRVLGVTETSLSGSDGE
ncbi:efflux RND transporter periplasmic adaptor subunit [Sansalvadorimonas sp. 2012CJ34-2]|uniref:Efflux RND transporter periplasmic adaptor subunit n=1 Tax=Parendozoicomonas callyspongiae TaxID=2942213 RepID=A0ABT0PGL6_9GAMM|nr:efflux RND transporter periplasmic adaptor subunit [Sansalvadorimonas sp. 2012CJ34-2]MCL6270460.1 efflux RND transporter periplasmic adaptor subunit [Sansalvadorimonas sp. 2012CJ34-2]